MIEQLKK